MKLFYKKIILEVLISLFVLLFVYSAGSKLYDHANFKDLLVFVTGSEWFSGVASYLVPVSEFLVAGMLCLDRLRLAGLYGFTGLMLLFTVYIIYLLLSGRNLPCSCGGVINSLTWQQHLVFNSCYLLAGVTVILMQTNGTDYLVSKK